MDFRLVSVAFLEKNAEHRQNKHSRRSYNFCIRTILNEWGQLYFCSHFHATKKLNQTINTFDFCVVFIEADTGSRKTATCKRQCQLVKMEIQSIKTHHTAQICSLIALANAALCAVYSMSPRADRACCAALFTCAELLTEKLNTSIQRAAYNSKNFTHQ